MNQGNQGYRLTKTTEGRKSHETVPLSRHSAESELCVMLYSAEFLGIVGSQKKILSAFTEAVKVTVYQKISYSDLACLMAVK
jgi:hypothetical protein